MPKTIKRILILFCLIAVLILPYFVFADNAVLNKLQDVGANNGPYAVADDTSLTSNIGIIISTVLGLIGVIFLILIIFAGYNWMTA
ncbi:MAG: hypothetical protein AAB653_01435, partial [Patescibacteria group bacterium]